MGEFMSSVATVISHIADILGLIGFCVTIRTYMNTKKLKKSDDRVSFRLEKDNIVLNLQKSIDTIADGLSNIEKLDLPGCIHATEEFVTSVKHLVKFSIWNNTAKETFSKLLKSETQVEKMKTFENRSESLEFRGGIKTILEDILSSMHGIIDVVIKQE